VYDKFPLVLISAALSAFSATSALKKNLKREERREKERREPLRKIKDRKFVVHAINP